MRSFLGFSCWGRKYDRIGDLMFWFCCPSMQYPSEQGGGPGTLISKVFPPWKEGVQQKPESGTTLRNRILGSHENGNRTRKKVDSSWEDIDSVIKNLESKCDCNPMHETLKELKTFENGENCLIKGENSLYSVYKKGPSSRQIFRYKFKVSMLTSIYDTGGCGISNLPWLVGSRASLRAKWKRCFTINLGRMN